MRRFYVVSTVMGNDEKCLLLCVGFRFSAVDLPVQKFCAGPKRKVANAIRRMQSQILIPNPEVKCTPLLPTAGKTPNETNTISTHTVFIQVEEERTTGLASPRARVQSP